MCIPSDGYADGGEPYSQEELEAIAAEAELVAYNDFTDNFDNPDDINWDDIEDLNDLMEGSDYDGPA